MPAGATSMAVVGRYDCVHVVEMVSHRVISELSSRRTTPEPRDADRRRHGGGNKLTDGGSTGRGAGASADPVPDRARERDSERADRSIIGTPPVVRQARRARRRARRRAPHLQERVTARVRRANATSSAASSPPPASSRYLSISRSSRCDQSSASAGISSSRMRWPVGAGSITIRSYVPSAARRQAR